MAPSSPVARQLTGSALLGPAAFPAFVGEGLGLEEAPHQLVVARDDRHLGRGRARVVEQAAAGRLGQEGQVLGHGGVAVAPSTAPLVGP